MQTIPEKFIGITGGSCSGKSILSRNLTARFGDELTLFSFDDMYVGHAAVAGKDITDWESPDLYRWEEFITHLKELKAGNPVEFLANESRERRIPECISVEPRRYVIVLGFLALHNAQVRELLDTTIYLDVSEEEIIRRRLARAVPGDHWDNEEYVRGGLIAGHRRYVMPQRELADYILDASQPPEQVADEVAAIIQA